MDSLFRFLVTLPLLAMPTAGDYDAIAGYEPGSDVVQHNRLDLDQQEMEKYLALNPPNFAKAKAIYETGAHSGAYATLTVNSLQTAVSKSASVTQAGNTATGYIKKDKASGVTGVDVTYTSTCVDNAEAEDYNVANCFTTAGAVSVGVPIINIGIPSAVQNKYRNLKGFSTAAGTKMAGQATFEKFKAYYGNADYGDRYVMQALVGNGAFAGKEDVSRVEGAKKGSAYMNVWMYVIREMEDAVDDCTAGCVNCNDDPVHAWDEAVAFYTGTLEGTAFSAGVGKMLYALADKRCKNFKTCTGGTNEGTSQVNKAIFEQFPLGRDKLLAGKCSEVPAIRDKIIKQMIVPLVQGSLRYAYKVTNLQGAAKEKAEGAVFSAAVLPLIHSCKPSAARLISKDMKIDSTAPMASGFPEIKSAFESTYGCLGITCNQVGGLLKTSTAYYDTAQPCTEAGEASAAASVFVARLIKLALAFNILIGASSAGWRL